MSHLAIFLPALAGFAALAFATERQQDEQLERALSPSATRVLRIAGWCALLLSLAMAVATQGLSLGLVSYSGHTSLAAGLVFLFLVVRHRRRQAR